MFARYDLVDTSRKTIPPSNGRMKKAVKEKFE